MRRIFESPVSDIVCTFYSGLDDDDDDDDDDDKAKRCEGKKRLWSTMIGRHIPEGLIGLQALLNGLMKKIG